MLMTTPILTSEWFAGRAFTPFRAPIYNLLTRYDKSATAIDAMRCIKIRESLSTQTNRPSLSLFLNPLYFWFRA
jgi:hypothetical protein